MLLVVGLGNPGKRYQSTRHNAGFFAVDRLAQIRGAAWLPDRATDSHMAHLYLAGRDTWLAKPQTYMNRSGTSVSALKGKLDCSLQDILIVLDDFLLDFGRVRFRRRGSDGGHNGLASVLQELGSDAVPRLRLGIGPLQPAEDSMEYVLSPFGPEEDVDAVALTGATAIEYYAEAGIEAAMNRFNAPQSDGTEAAGTCQQTSGWK